MRTLIKVIGRLAAVAAVSISVSSVAWGQTTYRRDDGTAENAIGLSGGGVLAAINYFAVSGGNNVITSVDVAWGNPVFVGQSGVTAGTPFDFYVWRNTGAGTNPTGPNSQLLHSGTAAVNAANIDNNTFQSLFVPNVAIAGGSFFVGVVISHSAGAFPFAADQSPPTSSAVSWAGGGASFDPNAVGFVLDLGGTGVGKWMIRANATTSVVPEPGSFALLLVGMAGVGYIARVRRLR